MEWRISSKDLLRRLKNFLIWVAVCCVGLLLFGLYAGTSDSAPGNLIVLVDDDERVYYAPPLVLETQGLRQTTISEADRLGYRPDPDHRDEGAFSHVGRSLTGLLLEKVRVLKPLEKRWNEDGSWNW